MENEFIIRFPGIPLIIGIFLSLLTAPLLTWKHLGNPLANQLLAGLVLLMGFLCLSTLIFIYQTENYPTWLFRASAVAPTLYGPLLYLYIKAFSTYDFRLSYKDLIHVLPAVLVFIAMLVFIEDEVSILDNMRKFRDEPFEESEFHGGGIALLSIFYFVLSYRMVRNFRKHVQDSSSYEDKLRSRWLRFLFAVLLLPVWVGIFGIVIVQITGKLLVPGFGAVVFLFVIHLLYILRPDIFTGFPKPLQIHPRDEEKRYGSSPLSEDQKGRYLQRLLKHMEEQKSFQNSELTLSDLSQELGINTRYLSQVINEKRKQNFMDFINGYRIQMAQNLLHQKSHQNFTVLAIAHEVGFKSRSAFYEAFKKQTGTTPASYRKELSQ